MQLGKIALISQDVTHMRWFQSLLPTISDLVLHNYFLNNKQCSGKV